MENQHSQPSHAEIAALAEEIYIASGRAPNRDVENWLAAEAQLKRKVFLDVPPVQERTFLAEHPAEPQPVWKESAAVTA
jgi:hypothetical protein